MKSPVGLVGEVGDRCLSEIISIVYREPKKLQTGCATSAFQIFVRRSRLVYRRSHLIEKINRR